MEKLFCSISPVWMPSTELLAKNWGWGREAAPTQLLVLPFRSPFWQTDGEGDLVSEASAWSVYQASSVDGAARTRLPVSCQTQEMVFNLQLTCTAGAELHTNVKRCIFFCLGLTTSLFYGLKLQFQFWASPQICLITGSSDPLCPAKCFLGVCRADQVNPGVILNGCHDTNKYVPFRVLHLLYVCMCKMQTASFKCISGGCCFSNVIDCNAGRWTNA